MWFFYFLPMLVAIGFLLARVASGAPLTPRASWRRLAPALVAIVVMGILGAVLAGALR